ncbi:MAG: hypothetical protein LAN71_12495, partial [Acidobacteriia bacterium]|nr:hypothetical protein [Terriglobia bacterium]
MAITAGDLAEALGFTLEGDAGVVLRGVASPERPGPHDLIYLDAEKHAERAAQSLAHCVVVSGEAALPGKTLLRCARA